MSDLTTIGFVEESIFTAEADISEENYDLERINSLERDSNTIRYEMNTIEYPIFSKDKKIKAGEGKKYTFNKEKNQFIEVIPGQVSVEGENGYELKAMKIPQEFEERIFIAITKILKRQNYSQTIYTDYYTIIQEANLNYSGSIRERAKEALERLTKTSYVFSNIFYSNRDKGVLNDRIDTSIFTKREIEFKEAKENIPEYLKYFRSTKVKEIVILKFSDYFFENIVRKGYLYFDSEKLLSLDDSIARSLYMMIEKWRNTDLYIKRYSGFLASRIPLSWKKENISKTIKRIQKGFEVLKSESLIKEVRFEKNGSLKDSYFEILFDKKHNKNKYRKFNTGTEELKMEAKTLIKEAERDDKKINSIAETKEQFAEQLGKKAEELSPQQLRIFEKTQGR